MPRIIGLHKSGKAVGEIVKVGQGSLPFGYLPCDGSAVSRTIYSDLYNKIGTTYGTGDGSTTFTLPDLRGRAPMGDGTGSGLTTRTVGQQVGAETHTLGTSNLPAHTHGSGTLGTGIQSSDHTHGVTVSGSGTSGATDLSHSHTPTVGASAAVGSTQSNQVQSGGGIFAASGGVGNIAISTASLNHSHSISFSSSGTSGGMSVNHNHAVSGSTDNGGFANVAVNHVNPALVVKFGIAYV